MVDLTQVLIALIVGLPAILGAIFAGIAARRVRVASEKVDENTAITKTEAKEIREHRDDTTEKMSNKLDQTLSVIDEKTATSMQTIARMLNGALDQKVRSIIKEEMTPLSKILQDHIEQDDERSNRIDKSLQELIANKNVHL